MNTKHATKVIKVFVIITIILRKIIYLYFFRTYVCISHSLHIPLKHRNIKNNKTLFIMSTFGHDYLLGDTYGNFESVEEEVIEENTDFEFLESISCEKIGTLDDEDRNKLYELAPLAEYINEEVFSNSLLHNEWIYGQCEGVVELWFPTTDLTSTENQLITQMIYAYYKQFPMIKYDVERGFLIFRVWI